MSQENEVPVRVEIEGEPVSEEDIDPSNVIFRAGWLRMAAAKASGEDREMLLKASKSLRAFHAKLVGE